MRVATLFCFLLLAQCLNGQLYLDASNQLPDLGARGQSMDVQAVDIDNDGDLDIVLANEFQANSILLNDGNANFILADIPPFNTVNHDSEDLAIADFNLDGHADIAFCSEDDVTLGITNVHEYYLGNGDGTFTPTTYQFPDTEANALIVAYLNNDTFPDLLFGNNGPTTIEINSGDGTFTAENNRVPALNRTTQDLALADIDGDGDLDLFEGNENGNALFLNDGNGQFSDVSTVQLPQGLNQETRKVTFGDVDNDNDLDVFLSNVAFIPGRNRQNRLLINDGTGVFTDATTTQLPTDQDLTIDAIFEDVDLDGDLDLILGNVFGAPLKVYTNDGLGTFDLATTNVFGANYFRDALGIIAADFNGDGLRDLYIADRHQPQTNRKDLLLIRQAITSSTTELTADNTQSNWTIYPNPVQDQLYIQTNFSQLDSIQIGTINGQIISTLAVQSNSNGLYTCMIQGLPAGVYTVHINGKSQKIILNP